MTAATPATVQARTAYAEQKARAAAGVEDVNVGVFDSLAHSGAEYAVLSDDTQEGCYYVHRDSETGKPIHLRLLGLGPADRYYVRHLRDMGNSVAEFPNAGVLITSGESRARIDPVHRGGIERLRLIAAAETNPVRARALSDAAAIVEAHGL